MIEKISDLKLFKRIVELGTLSAAAGDRGLSPGSASLRLAAMEHSLGTKLFRRTTRQLHLTEAGEKFLETASSILNELTNFDESLLKETGNVSGIIRVTAPVDLGRNYIAPSIDKFLSDNPDASINLICTDRITDLTERGINLAIRYGALKDSTLKLRRVSSNRRIPVASPDYIAAKGCPEHPRYIKNHDCILLSSLGDKNDTWTFVEQSKALSIKISGARATNDGEVLRNWAVKGYGIALKSAWDVAKDINHNRLVPLLVGYCPPNIDLQLVFPPLPRQPRRVRTLEDHLIKDLKILDECLENVNIQSHYRVS